VLAFREVEFATTDGAESTEHQFKGPGEFNREAGRRGGERKILKDLSR
jgi:hypothetical protein